MASTQTAPVALPRVAITFCTQCRWMLRAAYFAQELLSTFGNQIGEVALLPATGGLFTVELVSYLLKVGGSVRLIVNEDVRASWKRNCRCQEGTTLGQED